MLGPKLQEYSEVWGPPQFHEKRASSDKAILGALGVFQGILGAALGMQEVTLGTRNSILRIYGISQLEQYEKHNSQSHSGSDSQIDENPHERFAFALAFSDQFLRIGVVRACQKYLSKKRKDSCHHASGECTACCPEKSVSKERLAEFCQDLAELEDKTVSLLWRTHTHIAGGNELTELPAWNLEKAKNLNELGA